MFFVSNAFQYRVSIAILRMPTGLDFSFAIPHIDGNSNIAFDHSNGSSINNLNVVSSNIMHVDSNMELSSMANNPTITINGSLRPPGE